MVGEEVMTDTLTFAAAWLSITVVACALLVASMLLFYRVESWRHERHRREMIRLYGEPRPVRCWVLGEVLE